jgi:hypothetical protein
LHRSIRLLKGRVKICVCFKSACNPSTQEAETGQYKLEASPGKVTETLSEKQSKAKRIGGVAQVEHLGFPRWRLEGGSRK